MTLLIGVTIFLSGGFVGVASMCLLLINGVAERNNTNSQNLRSNKGNEERSQWWLFFCETKVVQYSKEFL